MELSVEKLKEVVDILANQLGDAKDFSDVADGLAK